MKRFTTTAIALVLAPGLSLAVADSTLDQSGQDLRQTPEQRHISSLTRRYVNSYHYQPTELNDVLSTEIFDQYIDSLDPARAYFLSADIGYFSRYRDLLDDHIKRDDLKPAFEIFNIYRARVAERVDYALTLLEQPFDFTIDESLPVDREDAPWATNEAEAKDYWRRRVKNDFLRLKLTGKEPEAIKETLSKRYKMLASRMTEVKSIEVFTWFMNAYTQAVEPHTNYFSPRDSEAFDISMSLSLEGIGALLERDGEYTAIRSIVAGGPASVDGRLQPGDRIVGVGQDTEGDTVDVVGWRLDDVVDLIRGPKDSTVRLEVLPADTGIQGPAEEIKLVRNEIQLEAQAASKEIITVPDGDSKRRIGVIRLPSFYVDMEGRMANRPGYRSSTSDVRRLIYELKQENVDGLMIDLRDNGGGALSEAITMTGLFIDTGPVVQVRDSRGRTKVEYDHEPGSAWDGPLAVLVNRYSASASEIFAGAIQDYKRGLVIGEPTFGKGTVQNLIDLNAFSRSDNNRLGQLKLTMAQFFRVSGESTQLKGVHPDILLPSTGDMTERGESAYDNALPWTKIEQAGFSPLADYSKALGYLDQQHSHRLSNDDELKYLLNEIEEYNRVQNRSSISLLESARRAEMDQQEERKSAKAQVSGLERITFDDDTPNAVAEAIAEANSRDEAEASGDDADAENDNDLAVEDIDLDVYLDESARILADFVKLSRDSAYIVHNEANASPVTPPES